MVTLHEWSTRYELSQVKGLMSQVKHGIKSQQVVSQVKHGVESRHVSQVESTTNDVIWAVTWHWLCVTNNNSSDSQPSWPWCLPITTARKEQGQRAETAATVLLDEPGRWAAYQCKKRCLGELSDDQIKLLLNEIQFDWESHSRVGDKLGGNLIAKMSS